MTLPRWLLFLIVIGTTLAGCDTTGVSADPTAYGWATPVRPTPVLERPAPEPTEPPPVTPAIIFANILTSSKCYGGPADLYRETSSVRIPVGTSVQIVGISSSSKQWVKVLVPVMFVDGSCWLRLNDIDVTFDMSLVELVPSAILLTNTYCQYGPDWVSYKHACYLDKGLEIILNAKNAAGGWVEASHVHKFEQSCWIDMRKLLYDPNTILMLPVIENPPVIAGANSDIEIDITPTRDNNYNNNDTNGNDDNGDPDQPTVIWVHLAKLGISAKKEGGSWWASVTVTIHDAQHNLIGGVSVRTSWGNCDTDTNGYCSVTAFSIPNNQKTVNFTLDDLGSENIYYDRSLNHESETLIVYRP